MHTDMHMPAKFAYVISFHFFPPTKIYAQKFNCVQNVNNSLWLLIRVVAVVVALL